jgi:hypothetical protein
MNYTKTPHLRIVNHQVIVESESSPTTTFFLDNNRSDAYTETGDIDYPFKNLDNLFSAISAYATAGGVGPIAINSTPSFYVSARAWTSAGIPLVIYGNGSTWNIAGGLTITAPVVSYDLTNIGATTYNYSGTLRSEKHGGAFNGPVTVAQGYVHMFGTNLSGNSNVCTVGGAATVGLLFGEALTGSQNIASGGAGALIALYNINMTKSTGYNIDMTNGGQLLMLGGTLATAAGTANIYLPVANTLATAHAASGTISTSGLGILGVNGTTTYLALGDGEINATYCTMVPVYGGAKTMLGALTLPGGATLLTTTAALTTGAGSGAGTLTNAPAAGNPTKWIKINDGGTTRYIPAW